MEYDQPLACYQTLQISQSHHGGVGKFKFGVEYVLLVDAYSICAQSEV